MNWAAHAIGALAKGDGCQIRPHGNSMRPRVESGALVTLAPLTDDDPKIDDIVLVKVAGRVYLHLVKAIQGSRYQIGNNRGGINGWVGRDCIYGKAVDTA